VRTRLKETLQRGTRIIHHWLVMAHLELNLMRTEPQVAQNGGLGRQEIFKVRSYQLEMLEESMKRNIIVAAETGSGKTFM